MTNMEAKFTFAEAVWGHPMDWPPVWERRPRWWNFRAKREEAEVVRMFGQISESGRLAFWEELRKGQSVYEDAGGYLIRCYRAAFGLPVDEPYTYHSAFKDALAVRK